ncbi:MAG: hypothetical protein AAF304_02560 [Pseudomonadota bacterium]
MKLILLHVLFLIIALLIAFALVPLDLIYFEKKPVEEVQQYYLGAFSFESMRAWKIVFTWFLGLTCGRFIVRAINNNNYTTKPEIIRNDEDRRQN